MQDPLYVTFCFKFLVHVIIFDDNFLVVLVFMSEYQPTAEKSLLDFQFFPYTPYGPFL